MRTKLFVFLMLVSIVLSACGGQAATPAPAEPQEPAAPEAPAATEAPAETEAPAAEPATLKIYLLDYTPDTIAWLNEEINPAFEAAHPGVTVEITEGSWSGWDTTFSGFFAAGEGPDIINLGSEMNTCTGKAWLIWIRTWAKLPGPILPTLVPRSKMQNTMENCAACPSSPPRATFSAAPT
jgi:multiple sugar transport system substrate-binding protein